MLNPVQSKLLQMLAWFHDYCTDNGLTYYVVGGTMLGAVRHGGFIPWDDDIDVVLPRPDYSRLIALFKEKTDGYYLESPYTGSKDYLYLYAKLYDTNTTLVERQKKICRRGLYIDVFPLDGIGADLTEAKANFKKADRLHMYVLTRTCAVSKDRSFYKNAAVIASRLLPSFVADEKKAIIRFDKLASSFGYEDCNYVGNLMGRYRMNEVMEKRVFGKPTEYKFENITVYGVEHYEEFLTNLYGDWRTLPPEGKRRKTHEHIEMDLFKPYWE